MAMAPIPLSASIKRGALYSSANREVECHECGSGRDVSIVLIGFGEGGHEPDGCTKGELVR